MVKFKIDCQNIMLTSVFLKESADEFNNLIVRMQNVSKNIQSCWTGIDATNFLIEFDEHISKLNEVKEVYLQKSIAMKNASIKHGTIDTNLKKMMDEIVKESDLNVYDNNRY